MLVLKVNSKAEQILMNFFYMVSHKFSVYGTDVG